MIDLSPGSSSNSAMKRSGDGKSGINRMDLKVYRKNLNRREKSELENNMRRALKKRMDEERGKKLALVEKNRCMTAAKRAARSGFLKKKQQEIEAKRERLLKESKHHG